MKIARLKTGTQGCAWVPTRCSKLTTSAQGVEGQGCWNRSEQCNQAPLLAAPSLRVGTNPGPPAETYLNLPARVGRGERLGERNKHPLHRASPDRVPPAAERWGDTGGFRGCWFYFFSSISSPLLGGRVPTPVGAYPFAGGGSPEHPPPEG